MDAREAANETKDIVAHYDAGDAETTAESLRRVWLAAAPPVASSEAGRKGAVRDWGIQNPHFEAVGTPVPVLRSIGGEIGKCGRKRIDEFLPLIRLLWKSYGREGRLAAAVALGPMELAAPDQVVPLIHELAQTCEFWEDCDQLSMKALEPVLRKQPDVWLAPLGRWVGDDNKWVRRAAMTAIGRLPMVHPEYTARCVALVSPALGDPDKDVKRALSFAVRACARGDTQPVKRFVVEHREATDADSLWVLCDVIRSMTPALLPEFADLRPVYQGWLNLADAKARRSVEGALRVLDKVA